MAQRVLIRHLSGTKAGVVDTFEIGDRTEIIFGRDPTCEVRYDQDREDLVSRHHLKLVLSDRVMLEFSLVDLSSLNGTFLNKKRITGLNKVKPGDVVQLGAGGPRFAFELDPRTPERKKEPEPPVFAAEPPPARIKTSEQDEGAPPTPDPRRPSAVRPRRNPFGLIATILLVVVAALLYGVVSHSASSSNTGSWTDPATQAVKKLKQAATDLGSRAISLFRGQSGEDAASGKPVTSAEIERTSSDSIVRIEAQWGLIDGQSGRELRQVYLANSRIGADIPSAPMVPGAGPSLPVFVLLDNNRLEPMLTVGDNGESRAIGGIYRASGFIVSSDGLILTNLATTTPWAAPYDWFAGDTAGIVAVFDQQLKVVQAAVISRRQFPEWRPLDADFVVADSGTISGTRVRSQKIRASGRMANVTVGLGPRANRLPARMVRASDRFELALLRIDPPFALKQLRLREGPDSQPGDSVTVFSFSNLAPTGAGGPVKPLAWAGKVETVRRNPAAGRPDSNGDRYELSVGAPAAGSVGGPVFDDRGRVLGIQIRNDPKYPGSVFALPIRYGLDLIAASKS